MQGAGNGRRRQRQHIQAHAPFFQPLFLGHAKALFFIDDQQAQVLEEHIGLQQPVRANQHVHRSIRRLLQGCPLLGRRPETADHVHAQAKRRKPAGKGLKMLLRQYRGRDQHRYLFAAHYRLESRPQGHFRLAEPNVAAQQPVHRLRLFHIRLDFGHSRQLVRRFLKRERIFELHLPGRVRQKGEAGGQAAAGIQVDQFTGQVGDGRFGPRFRLRPIRPAQTRQFRRFALRANIFLQQLDLVRRHVEFVVRRVADVEIIAMDTVEFDGFHADILADSVGNVHHIVAGFQLGIVGDPPGLAGPAATLQLEPSLDFFLGDHGDPIFRQLKSGRQVPGRHEHAGSVDLIAPRHRLRLDSLLQQAFPQHGGRLRIGH